MVYGGPVSIKYAVNIVFYYHTASTATSNSTDIQHIHVLPTQSYKKHPSSLQQQEPPFLTMQLQ